jgi:uncharacterized integral membrane protein
MTRDDTNERSIRTRQTIRIIVWVVVAVALVSLAAVNTQSVEVDYVIGDAELALWVVIAGSAVLGALLGYIARWRRD